MKLYPGGLLRVSFAVVVASTARVRSTPTVKTGCTGRGPGYGS